MKVSARRQYVVLGVLLAAYALLAAAAIALAPAEQLTAPGGEATAPPVLPRWQLALANAAIVLVVYGLVALAGGWFARRLQIPWVFREGAGWKALWMWPLLLGVVLLLALVIHGRLAKRRE